MLWRTRFETPRFTFEVFSKTMGDGTALLAMAWKIHCHQTGADPYYLAKHAEDVKYDKVTVGTVLRDGIQFPC